MKIIITRNGNTYSHKVVRGGNNDPAVKISKDRAREIVAAHPNGRRADGGPCDWIHTPCYWHWSVEVNEEVIL